MDFVYPHTFVENYRAFSEKHRQAHTCKGGGVNIFSNLNNPKED